MKIALIGYGKMGKEIEKIALQRNHHVILKINKENREELEQLSLADVAIEFTNPEAVVPNIHQCFKANIPVVVGSTGWMDRFNEVQNLCLSNNQSLLYASNFSIGVNLFFELNRHLAKVMNQYKEYDVMMEETHHIHKKDAPSGTGLSLLNDLMSDLDRKNAWKEDLVSEENQILVKAHRIDEVPGTHVVRYFSDIDDLEIKHTAHNRKGFALGAVIAAEWLLNKKGVFEMKDVLQITS